MFKNQLIKKLSIGIVSLALVCPLALSATQSVHANAIRTARTTRVARYGKNNQGTRNYPIPYAKWVAYSISQDKKILNTKQGRYYLWTQSNLNKDEKIMKSLKVNHHVNVRNHHSKKSSPVQTVYLPGKKMTAGYRNQLRQNHYLDNDFYGDISRDKNILRHHKSGAMAAKAMKNLAWARKGIKVSNRINYVSNHSFRSAKSGRIVTPDNLSVYANRPLKVALKQGIYVNLTKIENPESDNKVVKAVHLDQNTPVNAEWSSKGYVLSNKKLLPAKKGCVWIY